MNCQKIAEILDELDSRRLTGTERREVDAHLAACVECRAAFAAHEAMQAMALPSMSPNLADRCRQLVVAQSAGRTRRVGGRPFIVVGLLVVGTAAAAFVGLQLTGGSNADVDAAADVIDAAEAASDTVEQTVADATDAGAAETAPDGVDGDLADTSGRFTVAVSFSHQATNPQIVQMTDTLYRVFLEELRKIPNLDLVEVEARDSPDQIHYEPMTTARFNSGIPEEGGVIVQAAPAGAAGPATVANIRGLNGDGTGTQTLVLVDSSRFVVGSDGEFTGPVPTALVGRIEAVTGGASATYGMEAQAGVVNVIMDNNIAGVHVDLSYDTSGAADAIALEPLEYDYELDVTDSEQGESFSFSVRSRSASTNTSGSIGLRLGVPFQPAEEIVPLVAALRESLFPFDPVLFATTEQRVLDTRLPIDVRLDELSRLVRLSERSGNASLSNDAALAVVDMASRVDDRQRAQLWRMLDGIDNTVLIQPLSYSLRTDPYEPVRVSAVTALAGFQQDPAARMALELAASTDASEGVRKLARWAALDEQGRRDLVINTLLDTRLSDAERIESLLFRGPGLDPTELDLAFDATAVNELSSLLRRMEQRTRESVVTRLRNPPSPALIPLFAERLAEDPAEVVRVAALNALSVQLDEPQARSAIERARVADPSPVVRDWAGRVLETAN